jgi:hypothetical protein
MTEPEMIEAAAEAIYRMQAAQRNVSASWRAATTGTQDRYRVQAIHALIAAGVIEKDYSAP